jgi:outer membrane receptor protein involved in Fe transport
MHLPHFASARRATLAVLLGSTMLVTSGAALAQDQAPADNADADIIVTATKRSESLQNVPIAITALGTEKLEQLQVAKFEDYARYLPSVSYQTSGPGNAKVYFRGVASGENANHSTSQPSVGIYLDEQPITTIQGALDVHVYDVARVEALAGPQGTLYGASSEAGTIRIITNKPDTSGFYGAVDVEGNSVTKGGQGYTFESFINAPLSDRIAARVVGWYKKDAGYIDNIPGTYVFPTLAQTDLAAATLTNAPFVEKDYNDTETYGGRAALKIDLDDDWTVTPQIMGQKQKSHGSFAVESGLGDLQVQQFNPESYRDDWYQGALTIEGKIGNFDLTYAGAYLKRKVLTESDYSDYSYFYDALNGYGQYYKDDAGDLVSPNQRVDAVDRFTKQSHELRISSPADAPVSFIGGVFYQRQGHNIQQNYIIDDISSDIEIPGTIDNIWLTKQKRVDRDYAAFGEVTAKPTEKLTVTFGGRVYKFDNSLVGFFGLNNPGFSSNPDYICTGPVIVSGSPCTNVNKRIKDTGFLHKINLTYKFTPDVLIYATQSRGYRPGGINRRGTIPPYKADFIDNYEVGFKTSWLNNRLRFNGAVYQLNWQDLQLSFLGANGLSEVRNAGRARIRGFETDIYFRPADGLTLTGGMSYTDAKTTRDFCKFNNSSFDCSIAGPDTNGDGTPDPNVVLAPKGTRLPVTAKFKANALARYEHDLGGMKAHVQGSLIYEGKRTSDLRLDERDIKGDLAGYTTFDGSIGLSTSTWSLEVYGVNITDKRAYSTVGTQCTESVCGGGESIFTGQPVAGKLYRTPIQPRTIGVRLGYKF